MQVGPICDQVRQDGDAAVRQLTEKFDRVQLDDICLSVQVCGAPQGLSWTPTPRIVLLEAVGCCHVEKGGCADIAHPSSAR